MKTNSAVHNFDLSISHLAERLAVSSAGRLVLHALCLLRHPSHARWHWHGMAREFAAANLLLLALAGVAQAQAPCPGSDTCPGSVAQMVCPSPGTTLPGNDVTFTWCNANADYFLQIESIPGAHDIFFAFVPAQNFVHLINIPTNGATIYVTLWTKLHGVYQTPQNYTYTAASPPPRLMSAALAGDGRFQFTISGVTPGKTNIVQSSLDLSNWTSISTNVAASNSFAFSDPAAGNHAQCFYRAFEKR